MTPSQGYTFPFKSSLKGLVALSLLLASNAAKAYSNNKQEIIEVNAIDWCPQICIDKEKPGYIVELVEQVFKDTEYQLSVQIFPWSRAIKNVSQGKADALLSPAKSEAPHLLYPETEVGFQQMCFFTLKDSKWQYKGIDSLKGIQVGIANDTSIEELNDYVNAHPEQFQFQPYHERYVNQSLAKLEKGRMDTFLFTKNTTKYVLASIGKADKYRIAGCVSKAPIYMAFTPAQSDGATMLNIISLFDERLKKLYQNGYYQRLLHKYNLVD